jgi:hypothetical protein
MTLQQIFSRVREHLLTQKQKSLSVNDSTACAYRGHGGLSCAVGCLIPDEYYTPEIEGLAIEPSWSAPAAAVRRLRRILRLSGIPVRNAQALRLLQELQVVHDECDPDRWAAHLKEIGQKFDLA